MGREPKGHILKRNSKRKKEKEKRKNGMIIVKVENQLVELVILIVQTFHLMKMKKLFLRIKEKSK